ncbi:MAG TPA: peptidoglycan-binding protein [Caulobacteraceae bacterium]|nr:peptidoglycan-binding protein [Caulobacteraceae bacterium]
MHRRSFLALTAASAALSSAAAAADLQPSAMLGAAGDDAFLAWLDGFYGRELASGWSSTVLAQVLSGLAPDPRVLSHNASQPEFALPIGDYVQRQVTAGVVSMGRKKRDSVAQLGAIHDTYGVPGDVLTAIWGMESGFGASQGDMDVVRCLATLAAEDPRRKAWAETELEACLKIVATDAAGRAALRGSWAGAMGQTQLLPSTFLSTAVNAGGAGRPDIWNSSADALASAANLLMKAGWKRGEGWAVEVRLPAKFDLSLSEGPKQPPDWWADKGARRADGRAWSAADAASQGVLLLPAGAEGPAFLAFPNHFVIRTYNNSLAYALTVGLLADRIGGAGPLATPWPKETPLSLEDRMESQQALAKLGYGPGPPDGQIGLGTRQALRAWQKDRGLPADGYLSPAMVAKLKAAQKGAT